MTAKGLAQAPGRGGLPIAQAARGWALRALAGARALALRALALVALAALVPGGAALAQDQTQDQAQDQARALTLVALGDSLTQGYGLPQPDGLVPQLQAWLNAQGAKVQLINAGVSGDTSAGGRARIDWTLTPEVDALMVALGGNDLLRGLPPSETRANITAILDAAKARGLPVLLVALPAPGNYGAAYKADFDAIWPDLAARYDTLLVPNMLAPIAALPPEARGPLIQADGLHPSAQGVAQVVAALGPEVLALLGRVQP